MSSESSSGILMCLFPLLCCGFIGGSVALFAFEIIFLKSDSEVCGHHSALWVYIVVNIVASVVSRPFVSILTMCVGNPKGNPNKNNAKGSLLYIAAFIIYGGVTIYHNTCKDMHSKGLWVVALCVFYSNIFFWILSAVAMFYLPDTPPEEVPNPNGELANTLAVAVPTAEDNKV